MEESWQATVRVERYVLGNWARRVWSAEDSTAIAGEVSILKRQVLSACLAKNVVGIMQKSAVIENRVEVLEDQAVAVDSFKPYCPPADRFSAKLVANAATSLAQLKAAVLQASGEGTPSSVENATSPNLDAGLYRITLSSVSGEGGVGKTSTCKLLCIDEEIQIRFSDGAVLWIDVGQGATDRSVMVGLAK